MLVISWAVGIRLDDAITNSLNLDEWPVVLLGCFLGAAMGFHNVAAKESITGCPPTRNDNNGLINGIVFRNPSPERRNKSLLSDFVNGK